MDAQEFKKKMKSYWVWVDNIEDSERWLSDLWRRYSGAGGATFDRIPGSMSQAMRDFERIAGLEKEEPGIKFHTDRIERARQNLKELDMILDAMPLNVAYVVKEINRPEDKRKTLEYFGVRMGYTKQGLWKLINREIEKSCRVNRFNEIK